MPAWLSYPFKFLSFSLPYIGWVFIALILSLNVSNPFPSYNEENWIALIWMISPLVTWFIVFILDTVELFEFDNKGGRLNWVLSWVVFGVIVVYERELGMQVANSSFITVLCLNIVITIGVILNQFVVTGSFRKWLYREINLIKYGTTWRPSKATDSGSASLAHVPTASIYYNNQDIIIGTARTPPPENDSFLSRVGRKILLKPFIYSSGIKAFIFKYNKKISRWQNLRLAVLGWSDDPSKTPILTTDLDGHMIVTSGSGGGKSVSFVVPNMLHYNAGSVVCVDVKGEIHAITSAHRKKLGHNVYKLQPGNSDTDSFNAIGWLDAESPNFTQDCLVVASWIFPTAKGGGGEDGASFYREKAKAMFALILAHTVATWWADMKSGVEREFPTLVDVYRFLIRSDGEIRAEIEALYKKLGDELESNAGSQILGPSTQIIKEWCGPFVGGDVERTYPNIVASVTKEIFWLGDPNAASIVTGSPRAGSKGKGFQATELLNGKTSIYVCIPLDVLQSVPSLARLCIGGFLSAIFRAAGKTQGSTLFMLDELQALGNFPIVHEEGLNQGRGFGVTLCGIIQAPSALNKSAGDGTFEAWIDNTKIQVYFAIRSEETAEKISKQIGETTIEELAVSGGQNKTRGQALGNDNISKNVNVNLKSRRVKYATEIMDIPREYAIVFMGQGVSDPRVGKKPMIIGTCFYKSRPELMSIASENPFERKKVDPNAYAVPEGDIADLILDKVDENKAKRGKVSDPVEERKISDVERMKEWDQVNPEDFIERHIQNSKNPQELKDVFQAIQAFKNGNMTPEQAEKYGPTILQQMSKTADAIGTNQHPLQNLSEAEIQEKAHNAKELYQKPIEEEVDEYGYGFDSNFVIDNDVDSLTDANAMLLVASRSMGNVDKSIKVVNAINNSFKNKTEEIKSMMNTLSGNKNSQNNEK